MDKFTEKKKRNQVFSQFINGLVSDSMQEAIENCNTFLMMVADKTMENQKQHKGNTCKNRFCPICAWKKARKDAMKLSVMMKAIEEEENKQFIFLTLTAPNVPAEELNEEIKDYNKAFQRLMQRKEVKAVVKGYARKLEITYNKDRDDYHPHFHVLIAVNKSYFTDKDYYIKHERWLELWREVTKNPLITQVNVKKVRKNKQKEAAEIAKYAAKDSDYLHDPEVFKVYYQALKGKQLVVYSGLFKEMAKRFEDGELDQYREIDANEYIYAVMYNWGYGEYVEKEKRLLTDKEKEEINFKLSDSDIDTVSIETDLPQIDYPAINFPEVHTPEIHVPEIHLPEVHVPKVHVPKVHVPKVHVPKVHIPEVYVPEITIPKINIELSPVTGVDLIEVADLQLSMERVADSLARTFSSLVDDIEKNVNLSIEQTFESLSGVLNDWTSNFPDLSLSIEELSKTHIQIPDLDFEQLFRKMNISLDMENFDSLQRDYNSDLIPHKTLSNKALMNHFIFPLMVSVFLASAGLSSEAAVFIMGQFLLGALKLGFFGENKEEEDD